ncbi:hypothetical protein [Paractinoplanes brasiliensis]|uniref:4-amino-4-deoxy-L-arabinose transferase-like glycosyltransferase n=1 Tax=Paractinoplanes brasiliensis TaxID=52695 RepID=A0A4R6JVM2_9ACTN|nr:hypothetical protein [Actinoplanes brasiliensis]TDO40679.1 hypothetical protein C8E87_4398 [Actinoplanes brasiliensis]GID25750.1 hypothetical protein Abr02nite_07330 [Actinoplanes brasiliensis]
MSAPTLDAPPAAPRVGLRFVVEGPPVGALWRRALLRAVLVPLPVLAPLVALAPSRDHRFNLYWHGGLFRDDPLRIVPHTLDSLPGYLRLGNFRLFGRMLEKALDTAAYALSEVLGLPVNVGFRLVSFLSALLLCVVAVLLAESVVARGELFRRPPSTVAAVVPFGVAAGFVASGGSSPIVLFGGLYLASAALVLGVAAGLCRIDPGRPLRWWWMPLLMLGGAALAAFNEIAALALPLATLAVLLRGWLVLGLSPGRLFTAAPARALSLLWLGFLPIFLAVRVVIQRYCSTGDCYKGSDVRLTADSFQAFPVRAIDWLPPLMWRAATAGGSARPWLGGTVLVVALIVLGLLARHAIRDLPRLSRVSGRAALALALTAGALVLLGAAMGSLNADVQHLVTGGKWGWGWRDSAVTTTAGALLVAAALHLVRKRGVVLIAVVLLALTAAVSAAANKRQRDTTMATPAARLADRIAVEMADFDPGPDGAARRCALRAEFLKLYGDWPFSVHRFDESLEAASQQRAGVAFCPGPRG